MAAKGHYLMIVRESKTDVKREYITLEHEFETADEALDRYVRMSLAGRQRNRAVAEDRIRRGISYVRVCHPSSWIREQREASESPAKTTGARRKR